MGNREIVEYLIDQGAARAVGSGEGNGFGKAESSKKLWVAQHQLVGACEGGRGCGGASPPVLGIAGGCGRAGRRAVQRRGDGGACGKLRVRGWSQRADRRNGEQTAASFCAGRSSVLPGWRTCGPDSIHRKRSPNGGLGVRSGFVGDGAPPALRAATSTGVRREVC